eukprot:3403535-Rhodomonas_salina.5
MTRASVRSSARFSSLTASMLFSVSAALSATSLSCYHVIARQHRTWRSRRVGDRRGNRVFVVLQQSAHRVRHSLSRTDPDAHHRVLSHASTGTPRRQIEQLVPGSARLGTLLRGTPPVPP